MKSWAFPLTRKWFAMTTENELYLNLSHFTLSFLPEVSNVNLMVDYDVAKAFSKGLAKGFSETSNAVKKWEKAPKNSFYFSSISTRPYETSGIWGSMKARESKYRNKKSPPTNEPWQQKNNLWHVLDTLWLEGNEEVTFYMCTCKATGGRNFIAVSSKNPVLSFVIGMKELKALLQLLNRSIERSEISTKLGLTIFNQIGTIWELLSSDNIITAKVLTS